MTSLDSIEAPVRWRRENLVDGVFYSPGVSAEAKEELAKLKTRRAALIRRVTSADLREELAETERSLLEAQRRQAALPAPSLVYAGVVHAGSGSFRGRAGLGPREIHVLTRGDVRNPGKLVTPGAVPIVPGVDWSFALPRDAADGARRAALARWLTHRRNPLTWRSIVNRVWQYHFGRGIADSPNDFGRMGQLPTHPDLLDWLAVTFRDGGPPLGEPQSLKALHRLIVTSSVYRQASVNDEVKAAADRENRFLWRMNRRRLDAESIRDAVLSAAGKLDTTMYGPGFRDFILEKPQHSPHYEYRKHDPNDPLTHRRAIYRFLVRSQQEPFMETLDCADPSQMVAKRNETLTSLQALTLLNNKFMLCMAEHLAQRLKAERPQVAGQIELAYRLTMGRTPSLDERRRLAAYAEEFGLANACRLVFNLNEFVFVD